MFLNTIKPIELKKKKLVLTPDSEGARLGVLPGVCADSTPEVAGEGGVECRDAHRPELVPRLVGSSEKRRNISF